MRKKSEKEKEKSKSGKEGRNERGRGGMEGGSKRVWRSLPALTVGFWCVRQASLDS